MLAVTDESQSKEREIQIVNFQCVAQDKRIRSRRSPSPNSPRSKLSASAFDCPQKLVRQVFNSRFLPIISVRKGDFKRRTVNAAHCSFAQVVVCDDLGDCIMTIRQDSSIVETAKVTLDSI